MVARIALAGVLALFGCDQPTESDGADASTDARDAAATDASSGPAPEAATDLGPVGGERPALVYAPRGAAPERGWPILLLLHGFSANPTLVDRNFPFSGRVDHDGLIVVVPIGSPDVEGALEWAADYHVEDGEEGRDVPYLRQVVADTVARHGGDADRVYVMGHSNGGAMAVHLACHAADLVRGFVNVSGFNPKAADCEPSRPLTAVFVHGSADESVPYEGRDARPGADDAAAEWAARAGCDAPADGDPLDLEAIAPGPETTVRRWGCPGGRQVERWRLEGSGHVLLPNAAFLDELLRALDLR